MTERQITIHQTVEETEEITVCDACGMSEEKGEIIHFTPDFEAGVDEDSFQSLVLDIADEDDYGVPTLHYHVACLPEVTLSEQRARGISLSDQWKRRTGFPLLFVFPRSSLLFIVMSLAFGVGAWFTSGWVSGVAGLGALVAGGATLWMARNAAKSAVHEFTPYDP